MTMNTIAFDRSRLDVSPNPRGPSSSGGEEALDDATIAEMSTAKFSYMTREELVRIIRAARLPQLNSARNEQLEFYDHRTLLRLACLAQHCCRNRMSASQPCWPVIAAGSSGGE